MIDLSKDLYGLVNSHMEGKIISVSNNREELERYVKKDKKYSVWRLVLISGEVPEGLSS